MLTSHRLLKHPEDVKCLIVLYLLIRLLIVHVRSLECTQ